MEFDDEIDHSILLTDDPTIIRQPTLKSVVALEKNHPPHHWSAAIMAWERFKSLVYHPDELGKPQGGREFLDPFFWMGKKPQKIR